MWNHHRIRYVRNSECPGGRPDVLFFASQLSGARNCGYSVTQSDLKLAESQCEDPSLLGCSTEFLKLATIIMKEKNIPMPKNVAEGQALVKTLLDEIDQL